MKTTKIEWTERTWNPVTGCSKKSEGCQHCYAEIMARRLHAMGNSRYINGFEVTIHEDLIDLPIQWKRPSSIFVCSMSDLFHECVSFDFIDKVFETIIATPRHTYQILTKRPERMQLYFNTRCVPENAWIGTTVETPSSIYRLDILRSIEAKVHFISCEPLLADLGDIDFTNIQWVIVGGESGMKARPMKESWAVNIRNKCSKLDIPFFFKQWGTWGSDGIKRNKRQNGKLLQGEIIQQIPNLA